MLLKVRVCAVPCVIDITHNTPCKSIIPRLLFIVLRTSTKTSAKIMTLYILVEDLRGDNNYVFKINKNSTVFCHAVKALFIMLSISAV